MAKEYDYLLKVLLVGDSDVGKTEILNNLDEDPMNEEGKATNQNKLFDSLILRLSTATYKTTIILLDGKRVKLQVGASPRAECDNISLSRNFASVNNFDENLLN
jgi:Ras-related protein Rab-40